MAVPDPYDRSPYTAHAYAETHPDRLAVVARLSGWAPPSIETARVLELACGRGGNLLPMASSLPRATFVGVDRSADAIADARRVAAGTGLTHVRFEHARIEALEPSSEHDFVLAHGVASWIAPAVRRALLSTIARALAPGGIAYVSFNALPGWYERLAARDFLRALPPAPGEARAAVGWLRGVVSPELADYRRRLATVEARLGETDPAYAAHEYLADEHHPQTVSDLLAEAREAGLAYLGDAIPSETALELLPPEVSERAHDLDVASTQQLVDCVRCTAFRRALFVRARDAEERGWSWPWRLDASALTSLRISSRLVPGGPERPGTPSERFATGDASVDLSGAELRRALHELARTAPRSLAFTDLVRQAGAARERGLAPELLELWLATGALDLHAFEPTLGAAGSPRPRACPVARWHARQGGPVTNRWHQEVRLDDPVLREVLARLDGEADPGALCAALAGLPEATALDAGDRARLVRASLEALASAALLT